MTAPKKLTIYSEGFGNDVKIMNEDGTVIDGVRSATIHLAAGEYNRIELELMASATAVSASLVNVELICPACGVIEEHECER